MKTHSLCFRLYLNVVSVSTALPAAWVLSSATGGHWILTYLFVLLCYSLLNMLLVNLLPRCSPNFLWYWGFQWPPQLWAGRLYYDGWHYILHIGPCWIGREPYELSRTRIKKDLET